MLSAMVMRDLFLWSAADLSGVDGSRDLYVSEVINRAEFEVNEEGTEAAAATAVVVLAGAQRDIQFCTYSPFLFFVQHKATKSILFLGRLVKPSA